MFKLQWFKEHLFFRLKPNAESKEDFRENITQKTWPKSGIK